MRKFIAKADVGKTGPAPAAWAHKKKFLQDLFRRHGVRPRRKLGQNFILDPNLLDFIVRSADLAKEDTVLEVGMGTGQMTSRLAARVGAVVGVEVDRVLFRVAGEALSGFGNVTLLPLDVLASKNRLNPEVVETVQRVASRSGSRLMHVSNLAFRIATPLIINLLESELSFAGMVVTIQRELAEKMVAREPGERGYGPVSLIVGFHAKAGILRSVPPDVFWPEPRVRSAIIRIEPYPASERPAVDYPVFKKVVRGLFTLRRKTLHRALETLGLADKREGESLLRKAGIDPKMRAENLRSEEFHDLVRVIERAE